MRKGPGEIERAHPKPTSIGLAVVLANASCWMLAIAGSQMRGDWHSTHPWLLAMAGAGAAASIATVSVIRTAPPAPEARADWVSTFTFSIGAICFGFGIMVVVGDLTNPLFALVSAPLAGGATSIAIARSMYSTPSVKKDRAIAQAALVLGSVIPMGGCAVTAGMGASVGLLIALVVQSSVGVVLLVDLTRPKRQPADRQA